MQEEIVNNGPKSTDLNLEIARLQKDIGRKLDVSLDNLIFNYSASGDHIKLELFTINPRHDQSFLFHTVMGKDKVEALEQLLDYVLKTHNKERSYTVQWSKKGAGELHTSYFRARDMYDVLEKFYRGREKDEYVVFSVTMNPIA
ncbi:MAG: hypothetical protein EAZ89_17750 [Bacteroidetes bacterium]|nr:MAG: hypothetical protein EAZ89_17750 [Bacteroidota bacterium]